MDKNLSKNALIKSVLYEANILNNALNKTKLQDQYYSNDQIRIITDLVNFFVNTSDYWVHKIIIPRNDVNNSENTQYSEIINWLKNNNIPYLYESAGHNSDHIFKFISEDNASAFKLRFME